MNLMAQIKTFLKLEFWKIENFNDQKKKID